VREHANRRHIAHITATPFRHQGLAKKCDGGRVVTSECGTGSKSLDLWRSAFGVQADAKTPERSMCSKVDPLLLHNPLMSVKKTTSVEELLLTSA
jgi:hypothetical protein